MLESAPTDDAATANVKPDNSTDGSAIKKDPNALIAKGGKKLLGKVLVEIHSQHALPSISATQDAQGESRLATDFVATNVPLVSLAVDDILFRSPVSVMPTIDRRLQVSLGSRDALNASTDEPSDEAASKAIWTVLKEDKFEIPAAQLSIPLKLVQLEGADPLPVRVSGAWLQP